MNNSVRYILICTLLACCINPYSLHARMWPEDSAKLHYRLIPFSFPAEGKTTKYTLQIAMGYHRTEEAFKQRIIYSATSKTDKLLAEVPQFGKQYTWRVIYTHGKNETTGALRYFSTLSIPEVDTALTRLRIIDKAADEYRDHYVFVDGNKALYDMKGRPVWFVPQVGGRPSQRASIRDLKMTPFGTITFLVDDKAYEISYDGKLLWTAPNTGEVNGEKTERYHHDFTRLSNGHYMILGMEKVAWTNKIKTAEDSAFVVQHPGALGHNLMVTTQFGTVIEYNEKGDVVWSWKSSKYFLGSDLEDYNPVHKMPTIDVHENSFYFDEKNKFVYVGFKNISRIVKIKYPEGTVARSYGEMYAPGTTAQGNGLFCDQHSVRASEDGLIYLYNNNGCHDNENPSVLMLREPKEKNGRLQEVWSYQCNSDEVKISPKIMEMEKRKEEMKKGVDNKNQDAFMLHPTTGGNVLEMPDHSLFVAMNSEAPKIFIVNQDKQLLWNAIPERYDITQKGWYLIAQQYRASIITHKELEKMIWNTEK